MTREEFDAQLNVDTVGGLLEARTRLKALKSMAEGFKRPDIAAILVTLIQAHDVAVIEAEALSKPPQEQEQFS